MKQLKTRYIAHKKADGKVKHYTAEYYSKGVFHGFWSTYMDCNVRGQKYIKTFSTLNEVVEFIDNEQARHKRYQEDTVVVSTTPVEYP